MKITVEDCSRTGKWYKVYLDGREIDDVVEVDTEKGYLVRYKTANGEWVFRTGKNGSRDIVTERLEGKVSVELMK